MSIHVHEITAKSILRRHKKIDSWFITRFGLNLYRGCGHDCVYCDGRAETYRVEGDFGREIEVKINAIDLLRKELDPKRRRKPFPGGFVMLGGGVCDVYQSQEEKYKLARRTLELLFEYGHPVHILTKSMLVERDLDLLEKINHRTRAVVSFSFSSLDEPTSRIFEPGVVPPEERLDLIGRIKKRGIRCGMFLMPVIPFITDAPEMLMKTIRAGKQAGCDFVIFGPLTLKSGRQKEHFLKTLNKYYPELLTEYEILYPDDSKWGTASADYLDAVHFLFDKVASHVKMPKRIPPEIHKQVLNPTESVIVILEHMDYLLRLKGQKSPFGFAAYSISRLREPIESLSPGDLMNVRGIGQRTWRIVQEILETGSCKQYLELI